MNNSLIVLDPRLLQSDPRIELDPETLALAKRNACRGCATLIGASITSGITGKMIASMKLSPAR